jgi:hypothetical protein
MSLLILLLIAFLVSVSFMKIKNLAVCMAMIAVLITPPAMAVMYALVYMEPGEAVNFFGQQIRLVSFFHLTAAWISGSLITSGMVVRNLLAYRRVNKL